MTSFILLPSQYTEIHDTAICWDWACLVNSYLEKNPKRYLWVFFKTEKLFDVIRADDKSCQMEKNPKMSGSKCKENTFLNCLFVFSLPETRKESESLACLVSMPLTESPLPNNLVKKCLKFLFQMVPRILCWVYIWKPAALKRDRIKCSELYESTLSGREILKPYQNYLYAVPPLDSVNKEIGS